jgi:Na+/melibiose symporter-like transporter
MSERKRNSRLWLALLGVPFVGMLWVPFYNAAEPRVGGVPYFYWYQFAWIGIGAVITAVVYFATREREPGA